jgi:hypothetical protein
MGVGLPGIGISGLFYVIAALIAPIREVLLTARGRSSKARWKLVGRQFGLALSVVAAVILFYIALGALARHGVLTDYGERHIGLGGVPSYLLAVMTLTLTLTAATLYSWIVRRTTVEDLAVIASAHKNAVGVASSAPDSGASRRSPARARAARGSAGVSGRARRAPRLELAHELVPGTASPA